MMFSRAPGWVRAWLPFRAGLVCFQLTLTSGVQSFGAESSVRLVCQSPPHPDPGLGRPLNLIFVSSHARPLEVSLTSQPLLSNWQKFLGATTASSIRVTSLESCPPWDLGTAVPQYLLSSLMLLRVSKWVCVCVVGGGGIPWLSSG